MVGALVMAAGSIPAAHAQEVKRPPDIRMLLTQPSNRLAVTPPAPELRDLPQGKIDKLSEQLPITVILGDPRCYPGEDEGLVDPRQLRSPRSRRPH
jgi:hypothetical protein